MDIYFKPEYAKLYEDIEKGKVCIFEYKNDLGEGKNIFIKRKIQEKINDEVFYDIITPYGYGGPIFNVREQNLKKEFILEYYKKFKEYCENNNIVSEFIRFHPIEENHKDLCHLYEINYVSETIFVDLESQEALEKNLGSSAKKNIKKAKKYNLTFEESNLFDDYEKFKILYYSTMDKNNANREYYFSDKYFKDIFNLKEKAIIFNLKLKEEVIASFIILVGEGVIHYHLAGNSPLAYEIGAGHYLLYKISEWGINKGYKKFHLGGGIGGNESSLFKFKQSMNKNGNLKFYVGKKIWNKEIYDKLIELKNISNNSSSTFFPLYRKK